MLVRRMCYQPPPALRLLMVSRCINFTRWPWTIDMKLARLWFVYSRTMIRTYFIDYFDLDFVLCVFIGTIMWYSILWILHGQISQIVSLFHFHLATLRNCEHVVSNFYTVVKLKLSILLFNFFQVTLRCKHLHYCYTHISILFLITFPLIHWVNWYSHHLLLHMSNSRIFLASIFPCLLAFCCHPMWVTSTNQRHAICSWIFIRLLLHAHVLLFTNLSVDDMFAKHYY